MQYPLASDIEILKRINIVESTRQSSEEAEAALFVGATVPEVEVIVGHPEAVEVARSAPRLAADLLALVGPPTDLSSSTVTLELLLAPVGYVESVPFPRAVSLAIVREELATWGDYRALEQIWRDEKEANGLIALETPLRELEALGAEILAYDPTFLIVRVRASGETIRSITQRTDLVYAKTAETDALAITADAGYAWSVTGVSITGYEAEDLLQSTQFYDRGYEAAGMQLGFSEGAGDAVFRDHPGFEDGSNNQRVRNCTRAVWPTVACTNNDPDTDAEGGVHSTAVASILAGDITKGQDGLVSGDLNRRRRSGVARGAEVVGLTSEGSFETAVYYSFNDVVITNNSWSLANLDCVGDSDWENVFNDLYEEGIASFKSAGNEWSSDPDECDVQNPGAAIGLLPIAAYKIDSSNLEVIDSQSAKGGTSVEGGGRTIVAFAAPARWENAYPNYAWPVDSNNNEFHYGTQYEGSPDPRDFPDTSAAAPAAAGSAALMRDFMEDVYGTAIHDPGRLYTLMMLWGDGYNGSTQVDIGFDNLWGAGRLRLRQPDATGLDGPMAFDLDEVCVDHGTAVNIDIAPSAIGSDVDVFRAVAWWYDRRHGSGTPHDNIDLSVWSREPSTPFELVEESDSADNRERITLHTTDLDATREYRLSVTGTNVTSDFEGCGTNSMRVYVAWFYEDSDREVAEALDTVRPE